MLWKCNPEYEILLKFIPQEKYGAHAMDKEKILKSNPFLLQFKIPMENTGISVFVILS